MTTPEPRVRVTIEREEYEGHTTDVATWRCPSCGERTYFGVLVPLAQKEAHRHAATCPALRLAALLARLEELRDEWRADEEDASSVLDDLRGSIYLDIWMDLDALIAEARR